MASYDAIENLEDEDDVEMALPHSQISESRSASLSFTIAQTTPLHIQEQLSTSSRNQPQTLTKTQRLVSSDVFGGLTAVLVILVDDGELIPALNHSPWNGLTLADYVMPFFLFIVGVSLSLIYKNLSCRVDASRKAGLRALKLLVLGLFLQGGYFHRVNDLTYGVDIKQIRWLGILQRIALAYLVAALCEIWLKSDDAVNSGPSLLRKYRYQWFVALIISLVYLCLLYGLYVPDWEYQIQTEPSSEPKTFCVKCGVRGDTGPACNVVGMIDRTVFGIQNLYRRPIYARMPECSINSPNYGPLPPGAPAWCQAPFEPEGLLSSVMAIVTSLVGLYYGHIILHFKDHRVRVIYWMIPACCLGVFGLALNLFGMHINKVLYSLSYMCVTAGASGILFVGIYLMLISVKGLLAMCETIAKNIEHLNKEEIPMHEIYEEENTDGSQTIYHGSTQRNHSGGQYKVKRWRNLAIPVFNGEDVYGWTTKVDRYFDLNGASGAEKIKEVLMAMEGKALTWYKLWERSADQPTWEDFKVAVIRRFRSNMIENPFALLTSLKQTGSVKEYREKFELYASALKNADLGCLIGIFLNGLNELIKAELNELIKAELEHPTGSLTDLMDSAQRVDEKNHLAKKESTAASSWNKSTLKYNNNHTIITWEPEAETYYDAMCVPTSI